MNLLTVGIEGPWQAWEGGWWKPHEVQASQVGNSYSWVVPVPGTPTGWVKKWLRAALWRDLGVMVDEKLNVSHQCALRAQKAKCILGCIHRSVDSRAGRGILSLCSHETPPRVLQPGLVSPTSEGHGMAGAYLEKGHEIDKRIGAKRIKVYVSY